MNNQIKAIMKQVGKNIKKARIDKEINQERLAELTEMHPTYLSRVENATANISLERIIRIKLALNVDFSDLFEIKSGK